MERKQYGKSLHSHFCCAKRLSDATPKIDLNAWNKRLSLKRLRTPAPDPEYSLANRQNLSLPLFRNTWSSPQFCSSEMCLLADQLDNDFDSEEEDMENNSHSEHTYIKKRTRDEDNIPDSPLNKRRKLANGASHDRNSNDNKNLSQDDVTMSDRTEHDGKGGQVKNGKTYTDVGAYKTFMTELE